MPSVIRPPLGDQEPACSSSKISVYLERDFKMAILLSNLCRHYKKSLFLENKVVQSNDTINKQRFAKF